MDDKIINVDNVNEMWNTHWQCGEEIAAELLLPMLMTMVYNALFSSMTKRR